MIMNVEELDLMAESREVLDKIQASKDNAQKESVSNLGNRFKTFDHGRQFFEEFDELVYEGKVKVDMLYYEQLLQKLPAEMITEVQKGITSLYKTIFGIYEFINIKPEIFGNGINVEILNDAIEITHHKLSKVIFDHLDRHFYSLSPEQRQTKYYEHHKDLAKTLIAEGTDTSDAIEFAIKAVVMENLIKNISFPFSVWSRVNYLLDSEDYGAIFDQEELAKLVDTFNTKMEGISKVVASCV